MKEKKIKIPIFEDSITLLYGGYNDIYDFWNKTYPTLIDEFDNFHAKYWCVADDTIKRYILVVRDEGEKYIHHESLHATNDILHFCGVGVTNDNDEIQCRLMDYIANEVLKELEDTDG
ncbi:unnamed protein product [marine sediment metagenome]|uniref:Uncharacterized protein n=1 Tax=marine sediment metagenome TaxID=412755 RepID=X0U705_9ZZZZ